jgi:hypothetical protein
MPVVGAGHRSMRVCWGQCRTVRLLHFPAAPPCLLRLRSEVLGSESVCRPGPAPDVLAQQG